MKVRIGFVSNSSSSSFVLIASLENWKAVKKDLHPYYIAVAESIMGKPKEFLGQLVVAFGTYSNQGGDWSEEMDVDVEPPDEKDRWGDQIGPSTAFEAVTKALEANGGVFTHYQDVG